MHIVNMVRNMGFLGKWSKCNIVWLYLMKTKRSLCDTLQEFQVTIFVIRDI
jgi:hypothetical protein